MLRGIDPVLSPEMLKTLCEMGHGDEIVFTDRYFPAAQTARRGGVMLLRADGVKVTELLRALAPLFDLDRYAVPVVMMAPVGADVLDPATEAMYREALGYQGAVERISREDFYARTLGAYAIVATSETAQYGNVILKKGNFSV